MQQLIGYTPDIRRSVFSLPRECRVSKRSRTFAIWAGLILLVILVLVARTERQPQWRPTAEIPAEQQGFGDFEGAGAWQEPGRADYRDDSDSGNLLTWIIGGIVLVFAVLFFLRKFGQQQGNIFELKKSRARQLDDENKTSFADVGGLDSAIESLSDLVVYLRNPAVWIATGARAPRGILLTGPPGTGKTLLARALAGETQSSFFYTSATEFVEMFVGVGAARVRDTFENASNETSAVIFIDELDAIGRQRSSGVGIMHEEREQTLNQLLVLMDGLERNKHVIVLAATNRADVLDPALTRPGRFDRMLHINAPDRNGRRQILEIHSRDKALADDVDLDALAMETESFTGADLETLLNEAAIISMRRHAKAPDSPLEISAGDLHAARQEMTSNQSRFDRLDAVLVESVTQLSEPAGRAVARVTMVGGQVLEGDVVWMNSTHIKLRAADGRETIVSREHAAIIEALEGTEPAGDDVAPDRWTQRQVDAR